MTSAFAADLLALAGLTVPVDTVPQPGDITLAVGDWPDYPERALVRDMSERTPLLAGERQPSGDHLRRD